MDPSQLSQLDLNNLDPSVLAALANYPALPPPNGQVSNFDAPAPDATTLWVLGVGSTVVAFCFVVMRLWAKRVIQKLRLSWDDFACILAIIAAIAHECVTLKNLDYGLGKHMWNIRALSFSTSGLLTMTAANLIVSINMFLVRVSVLALYHRLFEVYHTSRKLIYVGYVLSVLIVVPEVGVSIARMAKCNTFIASMMDPYCGAESTSAPVIAFAVAGVLTDLFIYSIAITRVRNLQVNRTKKYYLCFVFAMGFLACVAGVANFIFSAIHFALTDQLWFALWVVIFKILEANIALACACATFLPAFFKAQKPIISSIGSALRIRSSHGSSAASKTSKGSVSSESRGTRDSSENNLIYPPKALQLDDLMRTEKDMYRYDSRIDV
ncbi:hypothetical protein BU24DRAFT_489572 [Aaosphaeria arxii CBS 175.79]|uniref:Rhodopsin domain-containing protein n=1 Tax=Aaosphaeria arxii CBS 175.79 TaxID=1450172 RepID=A0A6A5Y456_9PLEO|nr:uncharacterized protein BU24DRAFT_489572 [Aaosphaeria arxii CBS 175.79]KAF2019661.1 hypothetical protein BU24DRAFT_489572 [Aaosphaeria arxii CBS 175.79]